MKKLYLLTMILLTSVSCVAMESTKLSQEKASNIFWKSVEGINNQQIPYSEYRANLMLAIPSLDYTQDYYHNPLAIAVNARDYELVQFLLEHGADPFARDMSQKTAMDILEEKGGLYQPNVEQQETSVEEDEISKNLIRKLLNEHLAAKKSKN